MEWFVLIVVCGFIITFAQARECYYCGNRCIAEYWALGTKGICMPCIGKINK